jgi:hypothetical protein
MNEHNEGGLTRFRRMHSDTLREFAQRWPEEYQVKAREAGGSGRGLELLERIDREPRSVRPVPGMSMWRAYMEHAGRGRESHTAAEFPIICGTSMLKEIYGQMVDWEPQGLRFCGVDETSKLETDAERPFLSQLPDLVEVPAGAPPPKATVKESYFTIRVNVRKLAVEIQRKALVNDDKGVFSGLMNRLTLATKTSLDRAIALKLQTPGNSTEDSQAFFSATYHLNTGTTALTRNDTGANTTLMAGWLAIVSQRDNSASISGGVRTGGKILGLRPKFLITSPTLWPTANQLCKNPTVLNDGGTVNVANQAADLGLEPVMFDYYPDTTDWFLAADPNISPALIVAFLNGRTLPTIRTGWNTGGVQLTNVLADDGTPLYPLHVEVDFPFTVNTGDFRGMYGGIVAGGT